MRKTNLAMAFSYEQAMILDSAKAFCSDKSTIAAVRNLLDGETGFNPQVWQEMVALGWTGIAIPEEYGGLNLGVGALVPLVETMGRHLLGTPLISSALTAQAILRSGTESQRAAWLPALADGAAGALALLDNEDWGGDFSGCTVSGSGDNLTLTGRKLMVADGAVADLFVVSASHAGQPVLVLVEAKQLPAGALESKTLIDETKRACNVDFSGVTVTSSALLTPSASTLHELRLIGALLTAAEATGTAAAALDLIVSYLTTRVQFGRLIGYYQALKHTTVEILLQMDAARSLIYHAATLIGDGPIDSDTEIACRMAKAQATEALLFAGDRAVQFHGGMGFTYDCDAQLYIRRAQWAQHQYGDAQHHRRKLADLLLE